MSLDALAGRTFAPTEPYEVTGERVADFVAAIGDTYDGGPAPVTFPVVVSFAALRALIDDPASGLALPRIVHGEQRFAYTRPVRPGDVLSAQLTVESVRSLGEADYVRTVTEVHDQDDEHVLTAWATVLHRRVPIGSEADPDTGTQPRAGTLPPPRTGESR